VFAANMPRPLPRMKLPPIIPSGIVTSALKYLRISKVLYELILELLARTSVSSRCPKYSSRDLTDERFAASRRSIQHNAFSSGSESSGNALDSDLLMLVNGLEFVREVCEDWVCTVNSCPFPSGQYSLHGLAHVITRFNRPSSARRWRDSTGRLCTQALSSQTALFRS